MSVREYVGARYVPIFADAPWSDAVTYEPLTIVLYQGASYTSRQFVPVGIAITNKDFWALSGNYNAQVEQYRQEVGAVKGELENVSSDVGVLKSDVGVLKSKIGTTELIVLGDSWTDLNTSTGTVKWPITAGTALGLGVHSYGKSGAKLGSQLSTQVDVSIADNSYDHDKVRYVVIMGGVNDFINRGSNTIEATALSVINSIKLSVTKLNKEYKNANICVYFNCMSTINKMQLTYLYYLCAFSQSVSNTYSYSLAGVFDKYSYLNDDWIHPNQNGYNQLSGFVVSTLQGGMAIRRYNFFTATTGQYTLSVKEFPIDYGCIYSFMLTMGNTTGNETVEFRLTNNNNSVLCFCPEMTVILARGGSSPNISLTCDGDGVAAGGGGVVGQITETVFKAEVPTILAQTIYRGSITVTW